MLDATNITCAPDHIPSKLTEQLEVGGRLCIPVGSERGFQELVLVTRQDDNTLRRSLQSPVQFVPMTRAVKKPPYNHEAEWLRLNNPPSTSSLVRLKL